MYKTAHISKINQSHVNGRLWECFICIVCTCYLTRRAISTALYLNYTTCGLLKHTCILCEPQKIDFLTHVCRHSVIQLATVTYNLSAIHQDFQSTFLWWLTVFRHAASFGNDDEQDISHDRAKYHNMPTTVLSIG